MKKKMSLLVLGLVLSRCGGEKEPTKVLHCTLKQADDVSSIKTVIDYSHDDNSVFLRHKKVQYWRLMMPRIRC